MLYQWTYGCEIDDIMKLLRWMKLIQEKGDTWTVINYQTKKDMDESHNKDEYEKLVKSIVDIYQNSPNEVW